MSCGNKAIFSQITPCPIVIGSDTTVVVQIVDKCQKGVKIEGFQSATGFFPTADGASLPVSGSLQSADLGTIAFAIPKEQTASLNAGEENNFEFGVDDTHGRTFFQIEAKLDIRARYF